jgi:hypothetical protein
VIAAEIRLMRGLAISAEAPQLKILNSLAAWKTWKVDTRLLSNVATLGAKVAPGMAARWTTASTPL